MSGGCKFSTSVFRIESVSINSFQTCYGCVRFSGNIITLIAFKHLVIRIEVKSVSKLLHSTLQHMYFVSFFLRAGGIVLTRVMHYGFYLECRLNCRNLLQKYLFILTIQFKSVPDTAFHSPVQHLATHCEFLAFCVMPKPNKDEHSQQSFFSKFTQLVSAQKHWPRPYTGQRSSVPPSRLPPLNCQILYCANKQKTAPWILKHCKTTKEEQCKAGNHN